jgi:hypothetical protein
LQAIDFIETSTRVSPATEAKHVIQLISKAKSVSRENRKAKREQNILSLEGRTTSLEPSRKAFSFQELLTKKAVFRTIFIDLPHEDLVWASRSDVLVSEIAEQ